MTKSPREPIRVALVIARLNVGGPATHVIELASGLPQDRFSVRLFAGREGRGEAGMHYLADQAGVRPEILPELSPHFGISDFAAFFRLRSVFNDWKPDIVHTHTAKAGALGRVAARCARTPVVVHTFHGHVLRGYFSPPAEAIFRTIECMLAHWTDCIITLSPALKADLAKMRIAAPEKIEVVPLGMDLSRLTTSSGRREDLRRELDIPAGEPLIGIVGRLVPIKNHRLFLEAARSMVNSGRLARFLVVGDGGLRPELESLAAEWGIADRVYFLGWRKDMAAVYAAMDLMTLTSDNEGTPVAVIEALAAGIPVVATAVGGVPDVIRDGENGWLVRPGDSGQLCRAWIQALEPHERPKDMRLDARRGVVERYGREKMISTLVDIYERLVAEKKKAGHPAV